MKRRSPTWPTACRRRWKNRARIRPADHRPEQALFPGPDGWLLSLLGVLGVLALILGLLLVYNTINALISRQVDQIGVMKAIGGRTGQILRLFLTAVFIYGVLALICALPIGILGA